MCKGEIGPYKKARTLLLLMLVPLLSGCWDRVEMNDVALFMASGLDITEDGRLFVSIQVPIPSKEGTSGTLDKTYYVISASGTNIYDVERKCQLLLSRKFFKGHRRVVFIGETLAQKGIEEILDYYSRDPGTRLRTYLVVTKGKQAIELLRTDHPYERIPSEEVRELERNGVGTAVTFRDFLINQERDGIVPVLGAVEIQKPQTLVEKKDEKSKLNVFQLSSTAVMKNYKLVGYLNDIETRSLMWIKGELKHEYLAERIPEAGGSVGVVLKKTEKKIKTVIKDGKANIHIELSGDGLLHESNVELDISRPESVAIIEQGLSKLITKQTLHSIRKAQTELKSDIFGFGLLVHQYQYGTWKTVRDDWDTIFSDADVFVDTKIHLRRAGMISSSLENKGVHTE
ncbi:spore germination protein KC [Paenibacillus sp. yr247]|uniref:Ger(x)C family spore germination protein n=1 Tax=Paenibacillus sp. yr247 TaxID=1761880 RepID=UPI000891C74B|nr:Ger(x)C family spore germination protein [Paenibacillus sp. yr247]SDP06980.1 spore germination protein KC [Paenibacillus sp. yr247]